MEIDNKHPMAIRGIRRKVPSIAVPLANMVEYWGVQCDDFEPECHCCKAWSLFNLTRKVPSAEEVQL
jgi:hypothetical protein